MRLPTVPLGIGLGLLVVLGFGNLVPPHSSISAFAAPDDCTTDFPDYTDGLTTVNGGAYDSSTNPYKISTEEELVYLSWATRVDGDNNDSTDDAASPPTLSKSDALSASYRQTADLDLGGCEWSGIASQFRGKPTASFSGTYDGQGFSISGLYDRVDNNYKGMFGLLAGTVKNLELTGVDLLGFEKIGGVAGSMESGGSIQSVNVSGTIAAAADAGGLVGYMENGSISDSHADVETTIRKSFLDKDFGGLVGELVGGTIESSYSTGGLTLEDGVTDSQSVLRYGGLVGENGSGTVSDSFWDQDSSGLTVSAEGVGKTSGEMTTISTFTAWDIVDGWEAYDFDSPANQWGICADENEGYPFLLWAYDTDPCPSSGGGDSGRTDDDDDEEESVAQTPAAAPTPPVVRPRSAPSEPTPPAAVTGPVLPTGSVPEPPAAPRVLVGGQPTEIEQSIPDGASLSLQAGSVSLGLSVTEGSGSITTAEDGSAQVAVKQGTTAGFQGAGMQPGATVQVFIPLGDDDARELAQLTVNEDGTFSGDAPFSTDPLADPLPIGTRLLQLVTVDEEGNQVVLDISVDIEQADPSPAINRDEGVVPAVEPGSAVVMSAGKPTEATITGVEDQKLAVVEGDGWNMAINLEAEDAAVQETETGALLELVRDERTQVSGTGFLAGTRADVWLFSEPTLLGTVTIDGNGEFAGEVDIDPDLIPTGEHTLQLQGVGQDGYVKAANMGVVVDDAAAESVTQSSDSPVTVAWWVVAAVILLVLLVIVVLVARRRRYAA